MSVSELGKAKNSGREIGVLDLQGDVFEHLDHLERIGVQTRAVKRVEELDNLAGLIIPGGESTCLSRLMRTFEIDQAIVKRNREGMKLWGTCAGAILLAGSIRGETPHLALIDIEIERNGFGSQLDSFTCETFVPKVSPLPMPLTFIRAPKIKGVGNGVDVLLKMDDFIAAAESPGILVTVFHPELTPSLEFHRYFARKCGLKPRGGGEELVGPPPVWNRTSWMRFARIV